MGNQINYGSTPAQWPYPVKYGEETRIVTDVLIMGGGVAGAFAGLMAARRGVKVAIVDKSPVDISGSGGAGLDHYGNCISNPDSAITPEEFMDNAAAGPYGKPDYKTYITIKGTWDALLELERLGMKFRDENDEFVGAPFRDDKTKIMYAYDYKGRTTVRMRGGADIKKYMKEGLEKEKNASLFERVMITSLLTEGGKAGNRVVGATGVSELTGEFYVFSAKSVIICTSGVSQQGTQTWTFNLEMFGNGYRNDPRNTGDGVAVAWKAGADMNKEEQFGQNISTMPFGWPWYGIGNPNNTWFPCTIVDNKGKEIPWERGHGNPIIGVDNRSIPDEGKKMIGTPQADITLDMAKGVENGEYELPLWADIAGMPEYERRAIWGLMVTNEGRTRTGIYDYYNKAGFNPDKDMLQCPVMSLEGLAYPRRDWFQGEAMATKPWKADTLKGIAIGWDQMSSVEGLFACGSETGQGGAPAVSSGAYCGHRAAEYAMKTAQGEIDEAQVTAEKERVYAPVKRLGNPEAVISWKELQLGMNRVMQQDCGDFRTRVLFEHGLMWLNSIKNQEMQMTYARNPHELVRVLECESKVTVAEVYLYLGLANCRAEETGEEEGKIMYTRLIDGELITTFKDNEWWLKAPYAPTYLENYEKITAKDKEVK